MPTYLSPGIYTRETDFSFYVKQISHGELMLPSDWTFATDSVFRVYTMRLLTAGSSLSTTRSASSSLPDLRPNYHNAALLKILAHMPEKRCVFRTIPSRPNSRFFRTIGRRFFAKPNYLERCICSSCMTLKPEGQAHWTSRGPAKSPRLS